MSRRVNSLMANRLSATLLVLTGAACYGLLSPLVKMAYDAGYTPQDVTGSQFVFALVVLLVLTAFQWKSFKLVTGSDLLLLTGLGVLAAGTSVLYYLALQTLPASIGVVLLFQFSWIVMVIDFIVTRKKPSPIKWLSLGLIMTGTIMSVDIFQMDWNQISVTGMILAFLSAVTYSGFLYWNEKVDSKVPAIMNSFILGVAAVVTISFVFPPKFLWNGSLQNGLWMWGLLIGCLGQVIPPILFNKGIPVIGGALAGLLAAVELPVAIVAALLILNESVSWVQWLGVACILTGIVVSQLQNADIRKKSKDEV